MLLLSNESIRLKYQSLRLTEKLDEDPWSHVLRSYHKVVLREESCPDRAILTPVWVLLREFKDSIIHFYH